MINLFLLVFIFCGVVYPSHGQGSKKRNSSEINSPQKMLLDYGTACRAQNLTIDKHYIRELLNRGALIKPSIEESVDLGNVPFLQALLEIGLEDNFNCRNPVPDLLYHFIQHGDSVRYTNEIPIENFQTIINLFQRHGGDINAHNGYGRTVLYQAVVSIPSCTNFLTALIRQGAHENSICDGITLLDCVRQNMDIAIEHNNMGAFEYYENCERTILAAARDRDRYKNNARILASTLLYKSHSGLRDLIPLILMYAGAISCPAGPNKP